MATSCQLDISFDEMKELGYHSIEIPYEINHDFFLKAHKLAEKGEIPGVESVIFFPDYGSGILIEGDKIDSFLIRKLADLEKNLDSILEFVPIPKDISLHDSRIIIGYESKKEYDEQNGWISLIPYSTYVETEGNNYFQLEKKDIIYIIKLIREMVLKAKKLNKGIRFIGE